MPQRASIITNILFTAVIAGALAGCKPDASPRAEEALKWTNSFYTRYAIRGGWGFFGAEARGENVVLFINVPETQAQQLMVFDDERQANFIAGNVCPPVDQEIWSILNYNGDVIVQARRDGNPFSQVSCKTRKKGAIQ